jgi:hypothetical protein
VYATFAFRSLVTLAATAWSSSSFSRSIRAVCSSAVSTFLSFFFSSSGVGSSS